LILKIRLPNSLPPDQHLLYLMPNSKARDPGKVGVGSRNAERGGECQVGLFLGLDAVTQYEEIQERVKG
jgi:hypothetical protein